MLYGQRDDIRRVYCAAWDKQQRGLPLEPLERQLVEVIAAHPEYQALLADADVALSRDYLPETGQTNPFLHMGMHLAIREQLATDRPPGIVAAYAALTAKVQDRHHAEHQMMECLGAALWRAQRDNMPPDEMSYLQCLRALARST